MLVIDGGALLGLWGRAAFQVSLLIGMANSSGIDLRRKNSEVNCSAAITRGRSFCYNLPERCQCLSPTVA
jgi:hypothetical protein